MTTNAPHNNRPIDGILADIDHPGIDRVDHHDGAPQAYPEDRLIRFVDGSILSTAPEVEYAEDFGEDDLIVGYNWAFFLDQDHLDRGDGTADGDLDEGGFIQTIIGYADRAEMRRIDDLTTFTYPDTFTLDEVADRAAQAYDLDEDAAEDAAEEFLAQIQALDGTTYDEDALPVEVAEFIVESIRQHHQSTPPTLLDEVTAAVENLDQAHQQRDTTILKALAAGLPIKQIAEAAGMSRQAIYNIREQA